MMARRGDHIVAAVLIAAAAVVGCTSSSAMSSRQPTRRPTETASTTRATIAELRNALARWHRTSATITYHTQRQRPGFPLSVHQCLRQVAEERTGVAPALRFCDPHGVVTLDWDPPRRWRLDVTEGGSTRTTIVVNGGGFVCERADGTDASCDPRSVGAILRDLPFQELIAGADETVRRVGLGADGPVTLTLDVVVDVPVRCFERREGVSAARWCFAADGALLSLKLEAEDRAPTIIEAARVSYEIDDERFDPPWTRSGVALS